MVWLFAHHVWCVPQDKLEDGITFEGARKAEADFFRTEEPWRHQDPAVQVGAVLDTMARNRAQAGHVAASRHQGGAGCRCPVFQWQCRVDGAAWVWKGGCGAGWGWGHSVAGSSIVGAWIGPALRLRGSAASPGGRPRGPLPHSACQSCPLTSRCTNAAYQLAGFCCRNQRT